MTDISSEKVWKIWRRGGFWVTIAAVTSTVLFGVLDRLTSGFIPALADAVQDLYSPPQYTVVFSHPVSLDKNGLSTNPVPSEASRKLTLVEQSNQYVVVTGKPGSYSFSFRRSDMRVLPAVMSLKRGENPSIDTSEGKWERPETIQQSVDQVRSPNAQAGKGDVLSDVRWVTSEADFNQIPLALTNQTKTILATALREVGVNAQGGEADKSRIYEYWQTIPLLLERNQISKTNLGPWGGMFMSWVVAKSGLKPPDLGAAYNSWPAWGMSVPIDRVEPGMVILFATQAVPGLRGSFLGGFVLRRRSNCIEIITGNVVDRVAIACVNLPPAVVRRP